MAWHYNPEQSVTEQDKRVYTKLHSAQPESCIGLGLSDGVAEHCSLGKSPCRLRRRYNWAVQLLVDIGFEKGISLCTIRVVYIHATRYKLFFGMVISLLLETDARGCKGQLVLLQLA